MNFMQLTSPREPIPFPFTPPLGPFAVPSGSYTGVLKKVSTHQCEIDPHRKLIRFTYDVSAGENGPVNYQAIGEYYDDAAGQTVLNKDLLAFFEQGEIDQLMGMQRELDLAELVGTEVDFKVTTHVSSDEPAYSRIDGIFPAGDLIPGDKAVFGEGKMKAVCKSAPVKPTHLHTQSTKTTSHVFKCTITGHDAGTVHLVEGEGEAVALCLTTSTESHCVVKASEIPALRRAILNGDPESLHAFNVDLASFYCPKCDACFSDEYWKVRTDIEKDGWDGPPRWVCRKGHERGCGD